MDRGFFVFRWVKKKDLSVLFGHFCPDLKNIFNIYDFFESCPVSFWKSAGKVHFPAEQKFSGHSDFTDVEPLYKFKFFQKTFGARRARAKLRALEKRAYFLSVAKSGRNKKNFFAEMWKIAKKNIWTDKIFVKNFWRPEFDTM